MQQTGKSILCARPIEQSLLTKAAEKGVNIQVLPFIEIRKIITPDLKNSLASLALQKIDVVFTSINAVESVALNLTAMPLNWRISCIGGVTKEAVVKHFGDEHLGARARNASALARKIVNAGVAKEVYFFCGEQRLDDLPETLRVNNIRVHEVIVYQTLQTPHEVEEDFDGIMFFSPTAVHSFFSVNTVPINVVMFSIGKTTTATIQTYCTNRVITSEWPGQENLVDKVLEYFA
ncbi:MAG TPA: uroporphyrinogen-III synthase [Chitinophagaceae bacterium]|nr:uroporphyrinogen-III synthase [Chitinophagaceae bacterium]